MLVKKGFDHIPPLWNNIVNNLLALVFRVPFALLPSGFEVNVPGPAVFLAMLAGALTIGVGYFLIKTSIDAIGTRSNAFFLGSIFNVLSAANYLVDRRSRKPPPIFSKRFTPTLSGICLHLIGAILFWSAMGMQKISLVGPVSSIYPAIVAILAARFLKERISAKHGVDIGITILGLILAGVGGI
jgi:uncharacterized membrane protein